MSSLEDPKLPIPQCLVEVAQLFSSAWLIVVNKLQDIWDYICVWVLALVTLYHFTDEHRSNLLEWVRSKAPGCSVSDFSSSWKNGIALVALVENLIPNQCSCQQYHLLNPKHSIQNAEMAFSMAKKHLGIHPLMSAIDLASGGSPSAEKKLILYVTMLKMSAMRKQTRLKKENIEPVEIMEDPIFRNQPCLAKGMGLTLAVKYRQACFNIYLKQSDYMDIMIEIRGPSNDFVSRRITNRSPHHITDPLWPMHCDKSNSSFANNGTKHENKLTAYSKAQMNIILEYEIIGRKISVNYVPQSAGQHQLSIFWKGYHVEGSPFHVRVDDSSNSPEELQQMQHLAPTNPLQKSVIPASKNKVVHRAGRIIRRRVLRKVIIQNGQETEITNEESTTNEDFKWFQGTNKINMEPQPGVRSALAMRRKAVAQNPHTSSSLAKQRGEDFNSYTHQIPRINIDYMPTITENNSPPTETAAGESEFWKNLHSPSRKSSSNLANTESQLDENACRYVTSQLNQHLANISRNVGDTKTASPIKEINVNFDSNGSNSRKSPRTSLYSSADSIDKEMNESYKLSTHHRTDLEVTNPSNKSTFQDNSKSNEPNICTRRKGKFINANIDNFHPINSDKNNEFEKRFGVISPSSPKDYLKPPPEIIKQDLNGKKFNKNVNSDVTFKTHEYLESQASPTCPKPSVDPQVSSSITTGEPSDANLPPEISPTFRSLVKNKILQWENSRF